MCEILTRVFCHVQSNNLSVHVRECRADDDMEGDAELMMVWVRGVES